MNTLLKATTLLALFFTLCGCAQMLNHNKAMNNDLSPEHAQGSTAGESDADASAQTPTDGEPMATGVSEMLCDEGEKDIRTSEISKAFDEVFDDLDEAFSLMLDIASDHIVANGNYQPIQMVMNDYVKDEIDNLTKGDFFVQAYKRAGKYRSFIVEELKKAGLPEELSWLPLIESGYRFNALSRARALGLWQFIPSTGYKFGLKRNRYIDERLDPEKSTRAAIEYLKELYQVFGDWATVLAAYNCGEGWVLWVIGNQNINYLDNFWALYEQLPRETARYVPRFLATLHIIESPEKYGLGGISVYPPVEYETVEVEKQLHLKDIAKAIDVSQAALQELNPELRYQLIPDNAPYALKVPKGKGNVLVAKLDALPAYVPSQKKIKIAYHRVRHGETLSTIAHRYGTSVSRIAKANKISRRNIIRAGRTLIIPMTEASAEAFSGSEEKTHQDFANLAYVVKRGDSLWNLARQFNTTNKKIRQVNNLNSNRLHIGQRLLIPTVIPPLDNSAYIMKRIIKVRNGDVPSKIAERYNIPLHRFLKMNHLSKQSKIYPGQTLLIE